MDERLTLLKESQAFQAYRGSGRVRAYIKAKMAGLSDVREITSGALSAGRKVRPTSRGSCWLAHG